MHDKSLDPLNHALYSYVIIGHIYNFDSWKNRYKDLVLIGKNKMRYCKTFLIVIKMLENLTSLFILYKIIPFCQVPISPIESQTFSLLKFKALYVDGKPDH